MKDVHAGMVSTLRRFVPARLRRALRRSTAPKAGPLVPPSRLQHVGDGDFETVGNNHLTHFQRLCALTPEDRVLDIGSGTGRIARPLAGFLRGGRYCGIEIVKDSVAWCQQAYSQYPNIEFRHADVRNGVYNPNGRFAATEYRFPFDDRTFTFAVLTSVFTHMLPGEVQHYLAELSRVLAPGGRVFATFFLLDEAARESIARGASSMTFPHAGRGCWLLRADAPEAAVAFEESQVIEMCEGAGLPVASLHHGSWSGRAEGLDWQDIVILRPRG